MLDDAQVKCVERGRGTLYFNKSKAVLLSIFGAKAWDAPPQHGGMPPLEQGTAE